VLRPEIFAYAIECPSQGWGSPNNFFQTGVKNWLIIQRISAYNLGVKGSNPMKLCHMTGYKGNIITYIQHLGAPPLKIWEGKKRLKFGAI